MKLHFHRFLAGFVLFILFLTTVPAQAQPTPQDDPRFQEGDCPAEIAERLVMVQGLRCGKLSVPAHYDQPEGPQLKLDVVIIPAAQEAQPDPIVFAQGGPGGSTIDYYSQVLMASRIRTDRDLILFDQRGTKYTEPNLYCPEIFDESVRVLPLDLDTEESSEIFDASALKCRERMVEEGIDLSAFNSVENARDINTLREALGYEKVNLYGVSYGTLLALHAMREVPQALRSVVLDAVVPTNIDFNFDAPNSQDRAFTELFAACNQDPTCSTSYPNLEERLFNLAKQLDENPVMLNIVDAEEAKTHQALVNGDSLLGIYFQMMYVTEFIPLLPRMLEKMEQGDYRLMEQVLPLLVFDRTMSYGMYFSVICAEDGYPDPGYSYEGIRPELSESIEASNLSTVNLCKKWDVPQLGDQADIPVRSDIPVLIFNGQMDPITPPHYGEEAAKTLEKAYLYTFPDVGHGALMSDACADSIFLQFIANPNQAPNASCIAEISPIKFLSEDDVIDLPVMMELAMLRPSFMPQAIAFGAGALILLSSFVLFPLGWLVSKLRNKPQKEVPQLSYLASWLPGLNGIALVSLVVGLFAVVVMLVTQNQTGVLYFGLPSQYGMILVIALISLMLTIAMTALGLAGIFGNYWSTLRKIYHGVLILAALTCTVMLAVWELFTWWI